MLEFLSWQKDLHSLRNEMKVSPQIKLFEKNPFHQKPMKFVLLLYFSLVTLTSDDWRAERNDEGPLCNLPLRLLSKFLSTNDTPKQHLDLPASTREKGIEHDRAPIGWQKAGEVSVSTAHRFLELLTKYKTQLYQFNCPLIFHRVLSENDIWRIIKIVIKLLAEFEAPFVIFQQKNYSRKKEMLFNQKRVK